MSDAHLTSFAMEALASGAERAVPPSELASATAHLATCDRCRGEFEACQATLERFSKVVLPLTADGVVRRAASTPQRARRWLPSILILTPALAAAAWLLAPRSAEAPAFGYKGGAALRIYAEREGRVFQVDGHGPLRAGDHVRFEVDPGGLQFLMIASIDGARQATVYVPFGASESLAVNPGHRFQSPTSIELDSAPGPERVFCPIEPRAAPSRRRGSRAAGPRRPGPGGIRDARHLAVAAELQATVMYEKEEK